MFRRFSIIFLLILALVVGTGYSQANAMSGSANVTLTCTGFIDNGTALTMDRDNTGTGAEAYTVSIVDGAANTLFSFSSSRTIGLTLAFGSGPYASAPKANPITLTLISLAGNGFSQQLVYQVSGNCAGLPSGTGPGCQLAVPSTAVVGDAPLGAYIFSAPGQPTDKVLAPGTYVVVGQDSTETYYKIVLACQFVWVRKDTMQPSWQAPQNGTPLPTNIVN